MALLASSTVALTVNCRKNPLSFQGDLGATGDGVTNDKDAVELLHDTHATNPATVTVNVEAGDYEVSGVAAGKELFVSKLGSMTLRGADLVDGSPSVSFLKNFRIGTTEAPPNTNILSVRLESVTSGDMTVAVKSADPAGDGRSLAQLMSMFEAGQRVYLSAYDLMGYGYPQNHGRCEFLTVQSVGESTVTFTTPVQQDYPADAPEFFGQPDGADFPGSIGVDHGGPATLYPLPATWAGSATVERVEFQQAADLFFAKEYATLKDCKKNSNFTSPSAHQKCQIIGGTHASLEVDKAIKSLDLIDVTVSGNLDVQSMSPDELFISGSTIGNLNGTARVTVITESTLTAVGAIGPTGFGGCESVSIRDSVIPNSGWSPVLNGGRWAIGGASISGNTLAGWRYPISDRVGTVEVGETITGATSGATAVVVSSELYGIVLSNVVGTFEPGETVSAASLTSGVLGHNTFGQQWAVPDVRVMFQSDGGYLCGRKVTRFHKSGQLNVVTFDRDIEEYADPYTHISIHRCPTLTVTGCTGGDVATAYNLAPDAAPVGSYARFWLTDAGVMSAAMPVLGHLVSLEVSVTRAYSGAESGLFLEFGAFGFTGARLPSGEFTSDNADRFNASIDLEQTGTRVITQSGASGLLAGDLGDDGNFVFSGASTLSMRPILRSSRGGTIVDISGEDPSVWPEFTVTLIVDPFA